MTNIRIRAQKPCAYCGKIIEERPCRIKKLKYCCYECSVEAKKTRVKRICPICNTEFETTPSRINKGKGIFCSHPCWVKSGGNGDLIVKWQKEHKGELSPYWIGGRPASDAKRRNTLKRKERNRVWMRNKRAKKPKEICEICGLEKEKYHTLIHHQDLIPRKKRKPQVKREKKIPKKDLNLAENARVPEFTFIPLNSYFIGSEGHHIDYCHVIFIPKEIHQKYKHRLSKPETMIKINRIASHYLNTGIMPILR